MSENGEIVVKPIGITPEGRLVPTDSSQISNYAKLVWNSEARPRWAKTPTDLIIAMNFGREAGLTLTQSVSKVYVVNGVPKMHSGAPMAIVMASGQLEQFTDDWDEDCSSCIVSMTRKFPSGKTLSHSWEFSLADAKRAGLAGKGTWQSWPREMLFARACNRVIEHLFPDLLAGLATDGMDLDTAPMAVQSIASGEPSTVDAAVSRLEAKLGLPAPSAEADRVEGAGEPPEPDQPADEHTPDQLDFLASMGDAEKPEPTAAQRFDAAKKNAKGGK